MWNTISHQAIAKWCDMFQNERTDIEHAERKERASVDSNSEIAPIVIECILPKWHLTIYDISNELGIFHGRAYCL